MSEDKTCKRCGTVVGGETVGGMCPRCLMALNFDTRTMPEGEEAPASLPPLSPEEMAESFPQFEILECLGRGGMGVVYRARQKTLDRMVAIKVLAGEWQGDADFAERFEREAKTLAQMSHPNIVTVHDFGETNGLYFIVMEYVDGVNLRDLLREGKMESGQALAIVPSICEALEYAHGKGIVHRDIKPENLLLDREGRVKIADFGIASLIGSGAELAGTPPYMSPEQVGGGVTDERVDVYALGVVLYEMLTGERPGQKLVAPSRKVEVDVRIDEMVLRALEAEPEKRYQTVGELRTVVETISEKARTSPEQDQEQVGFFHSKVARRMLVVGLVLGCVGFLGFLGVIEELHRSRLFFGFFGFFGLVALAFPVEWFHRMAEKKTLSTGCLWGVGLGLIFGVLGVISILLVVAFYQLSQAREPYEVDAKGELYQETHQKLAFEVMSAFKRQDAERLKEIIAHSGEEKVLELTSEQIEEGFSEIGEVYQRDPSRLMSFVDWYREGDYAITRVEEPKGEKNGRTLCLIFREKSPNNWALLMIDDFRQERSTLQSMLQDYLEGKRGAARNAQDQVSEVINTSQLSDQETAPQSEEILSGLSGETEKVTLKENLPELARDIMDAVRREDYAALDSFAFLPGNPKSILVKQAAAQFNQAYQKDPSRLTTFEEWYRIGGYALVRVATPADTEKKEAVYLILGLKLGHSWKLLHMGKIGPEDSLKEKFENYSKTHSEE
ncbi:MAG: serine/threonine protein kinase [Roseibacillus sp.]